MGMCGGKRVRRTEAVIHRLVDTWEHPPALASDVVEFSDFPGRVVRKSQLFELSFFVELVDFTHGFFEGDRAVGRVQVPDVDAGGA